MLAGEVWARVGRSAGLAWDCLGDDPLSVAALAELTGKSRRTVYRALERLQAWDLAMQVDDGGWIRTARKLADVAVEVDAAGRARDRHTAHELQRGAWRGFVDAMGKVGGQVKMQVEPVAVEGDGVPMGPGWPWGRDR